MSERTFFCELYDGRPQNILRSTNDGKSTKLSIGEISMNIAGYHQPEPFLKDYYELSLRKDGFMERFLIACPQALRPTQEQVQASRDVLSLDYREDMRDLKHMYEDIYEKHRNGFKYQ